MLAVPGLVNPGVDRTTLYANQLSFLDTEYVFRVYTRGSIII